MEKITDVYKTDSLEDFISVLYTQFAEGRKPYEEKWEECWWNFIGQYNPNNKLQTTEGQQHRSRVFVRLTQNKVRAAQAKIMESVGMEIPFKMVPLNDNPVTEYQLETIASAQKDIIRNQFKKINLRDTFDTAVLEMAIYGTGILKGPVLVNKIQEAVEPNTRKVLGVEVPMWKIPMSAYPRWRRTYVEANEKAVYPVSIWDFYTDNNADENNKSMGCIERHNYTPYEFQQQYFGNKEYNQDNVVKAYNMAAIPEYYDKLEVQQGDNYMGQESPKDVKVTVLEYWGQAPYALLKSHLQFVPEDVSHKDTDLVECSVILAGVASEDDTITAINILKANLNPTGDRIYKVCPFIKNPGSPWGIGVAESIRDSQMLVNSLTRLMVDNKALSGNGMFAVNKEQLDTRATKDGLKVYPGKVFFVKGDANAAIRPLVFPDVTGGLEVALDRFERWADEESGIPKYTQGESGSFLNKMLDIYTPVPMADGSYKILRDIEDGDMIVGSDGMPTKVLKAHKIHFPERAYDITFKSGEKITAGGEHLWTIETPNGKRKTIDTDSLYEFKNTHKVRVSIPRVERVYTGQELDLPLDPYILGVWLGDGHTYAPRITTPDEFIVDKFREFAKQTGGEVKKDKTQNAGLATTYYISGKFYTILKDLGLLKESADDEQDGKHIPEIYFRASYSQRLQLLRGLMDTDGCHHSYNLSIFTQKEGRLLDDVIRLIESLGGFPNKCKTNPGKMAKEGVTYYNVNFNLADNPFSLPKKANKWKAPAQKHNLQSIQSIVPTEIRLMRCLTVDAEDGLFCVGKRFTVTHNTATGMSMIINQSNVFLKTTIRNIDEFWIKPLAKAFNSLNEVDGSYPAEINYPLDVVPLGVDSLMAKEIKFENAMKLFQVAKETDLLPFINKTNALHLVSDLLDVKGLVVSDVEAQQISQALQVQAAQASQASLSANIGSDLLGALTDVERAQVLQKMGVQADQQSDAKLLIKKAQGLELETQAKIMVNDRKELGKAQGKAADNILGSILDQEKEPKTPQTVVENVNETTQR